MSNQQNDVDSHGFDAIVKLVEIAGNRFEDDELMELVGLAEVWLRFKRPLLEAYHDAFWNLSPFVSEQTDQDFQERFDRWQQQIMGLMMHSEKQGHRTYVFTSPNQTTFSIVGDLKNLSPETIAALSSLIDKAVEVHSEEGKADDES